MKTAQTRSQFFLSYIFPLSVVVGAVALQFCLWDLVRPRSYLFLYPSLFLASLFAPFWVSLLCILILSLSASILFMDNYGSSEMISWTVFAITGSICAWLSYSLNERKKQEKVLLERVLLERRQFEQKLIRLFNSNIVGIMAWKIVGGITDANDEFLKMVGYSRDDLKSGALDWVKLTPPEWKKSDDVYVNILMEHGTHDPYEKEYYRKDGSRVPIIVGSAFLEDSREEGVSFILDISQLKSEQRMRQDIEARLRLALQSGKMGLWHYDLKNSTVTTSPELDEILGNGSSNGEIEKVNTTFIHPDDKAAVDEAWKNAVKHSEEYSREYRIIKNSGEVRWLMSKGRAAYDKDGEPVTFSGVTIDITEKKKTEEALEKALKVRDEFFSIASHELKTPLTSLKMHAQLQRRLASKGDPKAFEPVRLAQAFDKIENITERLERLVDDMMDISRIRTGNLSLKLSEVELSKLCRDIADRMQPMFLQTTGEELSLKIERTVTIQGDRLRLDQVISNLLSNALKYGSGNPVSLSLKLDGEKIEISVKDNGIGISPEYQSRIFSLFERADNTDNITGLGLGLYICSQIVAAHSGRIEVESELGKGSVFKVILPRN